MRNRRYLIIVYKSQLPYSDSYLIIIIVVGVQCALRCSANLSGDIDTDVTMTRHIETLALSRWERACKEHGETVSLEYGRGAHRTVAHWLELSYVAD